MEKWAKYIGVSGTLALMVTGAMIGWVSTGIPVPPEVYAILGASWGYYFGTNGKVIVNDQKAKASNVS